MFLGHLCGELWKLEGKAVETLQEEGTTVSRANHQNQRAGPLNIVLGSLFLVASISWLIWSSLSPSAKWQRQDLLFQICYGMYGFMDVVCIGEGTSLSPAQHLPPTDILRRAGKVGNPFQT